MLNERKLTERELDKRSEAIQGLLSNKRKLVKKYGKDAEKVMYGIATKQAKNKVEDMNKDKLKELIQKALMPEATSTVDTGFSGRADYGEEDKALGSEDELEMKGLEEDKELEDWNSEFGDDEESQERIDNEDYPLKEDKFSNSTLNDVMQSIRNLAHATGMDELEAAEIAINEIRIEFGVDAFHESALDKRVAKIDEMIDYDEALNLRAIKAELEGEIQGVRMEMDDEGDESKADYYGDILNRFESRLAKVQRQLDDYDMNESKDIKEDDENLFKPRIVKNKNNPNFLSIHINYPPGAGVLTALGKETMSGQQRREGAIKAMKMGNVIAKKLESKYNLEDIEVSDNENGKVTVFAVSDDFINMKSPSIDEEVTKSEEEKLKKISKELKGASKMHASQSKKIAKLVKEKLTKKSSVEDHVEDFKDSDAPQFKGKSKDKKVQMAVAAYLSKKNK